MMRFHDWRSVLPCASTGGMRWKSHEGESPAAFANRRDVFRRPGVSSWPGAGIHRREFGSRFSSMSNDAAAGLLSWCFYRIVYALKISGDFDSWHCILFEAFVSPRLWLA